MPDFNPLWIVVFLAVAGALVRGLFWLRDVQMAVKVLQGDVKVLQGDMARVFDRLPALPAVAGSSPVRLTSRGEEMAQFLRAREWATGTATVLVREVVNKRPFEIEEFCRQYVSKSLEPNIRERVAACAYEFGTAREGVESVLWVVLRDELIRRAEAFHK